MARRGAGVKAYAYQSTTLPWRKRRFRSDSAAGSRFAEQLLTVVTSYRHQDRYLLILLVAAGQAALQATAAPSLLPAPQGD